MDGIPHFATVSLREELTRWLASTGGRSIGSRSVYEHLEPSLSSVKARMTRSRTSEMADLIKRLAKLYATKRRYAGCQD